MEILTGEMVRLGSRVVNKEDAIRQAGEVLVNTGCAAASYIEGMLKRENVVSPYISRDVARTRDNPRIGSNEKSISQS